MKPDIKSWSSFNVLLLYILGCAFSQSLMSLGGTLLAAITIFSIFPILREHQANSVLKFFIFTTLAYTFFSIANLLLREFDSRTLQTLSKLPLMLVPLAALSPLLRLDQKKLSLLIKIYVVSLFFVLIRCVDQGFIEKSAATGFMRNSIYFAYSLLPAMVFLTEYGLKIKGRDRLWCIVGGVFGVLCVILSHNRGVPLVLGLYFITRTGKNLFFFARKPLTWAFVLTIGLTGFALYKTNPVMQEKLTRTFSGEDPSIQWRLVAWKYNWQQFLSSPLVGVGPEKNGIDVAKMPEYRGHWLPNSLIFAHNIYFQELATGGIIGFILLLGIMISASFTSTSLAFFMFAFSLGGLTENTLNNSRALHPFIFFFFLTLLYDLQQKKIGAPCPRTP